MKGKICIYFLLALYLNMIICDEMKKNKINWNWNDMYTQVQCNLMSIYFVIFRPVNISSLFGWIVSNRSRILNSTKYLSSKFFHFSTRSLDLVWRNIYCNIARIFVESTGIDVMYSIYLRRQLLSAADCNVYELPQLKWKDTEIPCRENCVSVLL